MLCRLFLQCGKLFPQFFLLPLVLWKKIVYACACKPAECVILIQPAYDFINLLKPFLYGSLLPLNQQAIFNRRAAAREGENTEVGTRFLCLLRMFLSFRLLSLTTEKKLFCQTYAKEKRCNLKKRLQRFLNPVQF